MSIEYHQPAALFMMMPQGKVATLSSPQPRFSSGDRLGKYLIREFIARSRMGEACRATDTVLMRDGALKQHPNIAMIFA